MVLTIMPERSVQVHRSDWPWLNPDLKQLIHKRQKVFSSMFTLLFKVVRNKVNRERKRCREIYYNGIYYTGFTIRDLKNTHPRDLWLEVNPFSPVGFPIDE